MKKLKTTLLTLAAAASTLAVGPAVRGADPGAPEASGKFSAAQVQATFDAFTRAILEDDVSAFSALVSNEVHARSVDRGIALSKLVEKQRRAISRTFGLAEGIDPKFEVDEILVQGDVARVTLRFRGEELKKPFYFVREGDALKLNIAPPGFSKPAPKGALFGRENYRVHNVNIFGNGSFTVQCYQGSGLPYRNVTVPASSSRTVSCQDSCGWFAGSTFADLNQNRVRKCDWNWWGDDVIINLLDAGGWRCNDNC